MLRWDRHWVIKMFFGRYEYEFLIIQRILHRGLVVSDERIEEGDTYNIRTGMTLHYRPMLSMNLT